MWENQLCNWYAMYCEIEVVSKCVWSKMTTVTVVDWIAEESTIHHVFARLTCICF